ncbi:MAG: XisI protein [Cyanobacteriota bacterium]|nr:XisI protein [Cyanobacteriota bacterium]
MEKLEKYRNFVEKVIVKYAQFKPSNGNIEVQEVLDRERDRYLLLNVGWDNKHRVQRCVLQIDIKNGKIWVQQDSTEIGIANEFIEMGVPKEDIVLAFYSPYRRQYTDFAVS